MTSKLVPVLSTNNKNERDEFIKFYEKGHYYEILSDKTSTYTSVTTWVHSHFPKFNADVIINSMMKGKNWGPGHKYWGQSVEEIKAGWNVNRDSMANAGTNLHERIEHWWD